MARRNSVGFCVLAAALALATAACSSSGSGSGQAAGTGDNAGAGPTSTGAANLSTITVGYKKIGDYAPLVAGVDMGFFKDAGLNVKLIASAGSASADIALVVNGQENVAVGSTIPVETAAAKGIGVQFLTGWNQDVDGPNGTDYQVVASAKSGIKSFKDLAGHKVAVAGLNDGFDLYTRTSVEKAGGDSSKIQSVEIPFPNQVQALKSGQVDAIASEAPYTTEAIAAGGVAIGDPMNTALGSNSDTKASFVSSSWLSSHQAQAKAFVSALNRSFNWANANPSGLQSQTAKLTGESLDAVKKLPVSKFSVQVNPTFINEDLDILLKAKLIKSKPSLDKLIATVD